MLSPSSSPSDAADISLRHEDVIVQAVADRFGFDPSELSVLGEESFESPSEPGSYNFVLSHASGLYGVHARLSGANLTDVTCMSLQ